MKPIRGGLLSGVGVALLLLALAPATSWAAFPGGNGLIAYSEPRAGGFPNYDGQNWEIFTIAPQGGDPTRLTDNAIADRQPSWSADGQRLTFIRGSAYSGQNQNVWTMRADGTHQRQVTHGDTPDFTPSFSPGGGRIVMVHGGNIVVVPTNGEDRVRLTRNRYARYPVFSPNGKRILFSGRPRKGVRRGLWVMRRDGTHKRLLANQDRDPWDSAAEYFHPDFSPDGAHIVFRREVCISPGCEDLGVALMRRDGSRIRKLGGGREPVFSPNGNRIAAVQDYCDFDQDDCTSNVITFARNGTDRRPVTHPEAPFDSESDPSWQPIPEP